MTKWLLVFLLLCQGAFAQQQLAVYTSLNGNQSTGNNFLQPVNGREAGVQQTEDTAAANAGNEGGLSIQDYKKQLSQRPNDTLLLYQVGHCFAADTTGLLKDSALKYFNKAISKSQAFYDAYLERGYLYALQFGSFKKAHKDFERSIEIKPVNQYAYLYNGMLYFNEREYKKAKLMYDKAIELFPGFGEAYYERSLTWYEIGVNTMVCSDLDKAVKLGFAKAEEARKTYCEYQ